MYSAERQCIFIHIPKTAGSSIEQVIRPRARRAADQLWGGFIAPHRNRYQTGGLQHLKAWQVRDALGGDVFERGFRFTIVRNPWDRVISQYRYMARREDLRALVGMPGHASLAEYLALTERVEHVQWAPQLPFLIDDDGRLMVDFVGRFETLAADAAAIFAMVGCGGARLPHRGKSDRDPAYQRYDDATTRAVVARRYAQDIEAFGYRF